MASRTLSESHMRQIEILKVMSQQTSTEPRQYEISEIATLSQMKDEKEVQRYLLILEGQKLVSPHPKGDFTSSRWQITRQGMRAMRSISNATVN